MSETTDTVDCECGRRAVRRTSWTPENPGRRFLACRDYNSGGCNFFGWDDPEMCPRSRAIIPGLLRRMNAMEKDQKKLRNDELLKRIDEMDKEQNRLKIENQKLKASNKKLKQMVVLLPLVVFIHHWISNAFGKNDMQMKMLQ